MATTPPPFSKPNSSFPVAGAAAEGPLQYGEMYGYIFSSPNWVANVLLAALCGLIPLLGPIVLLGYRYEIVESFVKNPGAMYPDFSFNRFGDYLGRGIWPFLVLLLVGLLAIPLVLILYFVFIVVALLTASISEALAGVVVILGFLLYWASILLMTALLGALGMPMALRAGLTKDFGAAFDMGFMKQFFGLVWKETLLGFIVLYLANALLGIAGLMVLCIGIYPAIAIAMLAQSHLEFQLYRMFLSRGGAAIPLPASGPTSPGGPFPPQGGPTGW
jgi:hypothetical protein